MCLPRVSPDEQALLHLFGFQLCLPTELLQIYCNLFSQCNLFTLFLSFFCFTPARRGRAHRLYFCSRRTLAAVTKTPACSYGCVLARRTKKRRALKADMKKKKNKNKRNARCGIGIKCARKRRQKFT